MKTKFLMAASAVIMGTAGLAGTFLPQELLRALHLPVSDVLTLMVQLHAALLLAFAMLNWMAKESLIGGIYNRPLGIGNLVHFVVGAITLGKFISGGAGPLFVIATVIYAAFAIAFGVVVFGVRMPPQRSQP
jgi:hypothetical protein